MKYVELFGGIGGFSLGIKKAYPEAECVGYYEIDKYAVQTYNKNFGTDWKPMDITKVDAKDVPEHDILCAGFPCQSFSIAGKRLGFEDTRGTLFFEIARIAKRRKPQILFLENVKGLLSHDKGRTFATILATLDELGYNAEWQVLNSKYFGVPQNRERVFIIGHLRGKSGRQVFPISNKNTEVNQGKELPEQISNTLRTNYSNGYSNETYVLEEKREYDNISPNLMARARTDETPLIFAMRGIGEENTQTMEINQEGVSNTLSGVQKDNLVLEIRNQERSIRRLTEIECERLMGFPDRFTEGVSATQRYKQLGNSVVVNIIEVITKKLKEGIKI